MIPMFYYANVKLPYVGWTGKEFSTRKEARSWIAKMLRMARSNGRTNSMLRPSKQTAYYVRPQLLRLEHLDYADFMS